MAALGHSLRCLKVVVRKNFVLKARSWSATLLELALPVALMGLIIWIRTEITTESVPARSYLAAPENNPTWFSALARNATDDFGPVLGKALEAICDTPSPSGLCPEIYAKATWSRRKEHYLGVALDGLLLLHMSLKNQQLGVVGQRSLADFIAAIPGYSIAEGATRKSFVRFFEDDKALQSYIAAKDYGFRASSPQLFGVIDVRSVAERGADGAYSGDWDAVIRLNSTGPGSVDIQGATDINTKASSPTSPLKKGLDMKAARIFWSGGLFLSSGLPLPTGGFVDLQSLLYAWIYNTTGAFTLPDPKSIPVCECRDRVTNLTTQDLGKCNSAEVLLQVLTPAWSTSAGGLPAKGCLGRLSGLFPLSVREVPFPTPAYTKDTFAQIIQRVFGLFFTLLFLWPLTRIMKSLTEDKEGRINEVMKMMGLPAEAITVGWYVTYGLLWAIPAAVIPLMCGTTVFRHSDKLVIFLFFWLFGVCVVALCSLLAVFFERARTASVVGALLFFLLYFPYVFVSGPSSALGTKALASLCPPVALSFGASLIAEFESAGEGVQWGNLWVELDNFAMGYVILMMVVDSFLFAALAWYMDKVCVVGFGTRQPWNFLCRPGYWRPERSGLSEEEARDLEAGFDDAAPGNPRYEPVTPQTALRRSVLLRDLQKLFRTQEGQLLAAVQGLTMNIYAGQILCLLGHNGAGKTTTINMLSGMLPVDGGDAVVYGRSVRKDMASIRKILGICPQHDVIWPQLSVREHLAFFAEVKGVDAEEVAAEVRGTIASFGLQEKQDSLAGTLSGGQKRRLSAGIALIGGSKVVFLDEPSSGVDPFARRELWGCLKSKKEGRTIILTTHFMDEAEELGDRIAIMAAGQIKCVGSSLFLKAQYGVGYTLTITKRAEATPDRLAELRGLITQTCPSAQLLSDAGVELVYRMPMEESRAFPALFECFERSPQQLGLDFFSVSVTTLEEVFLRVGQDHGADLTAEERVAERSFTRQLSAGGTAAAVGAPPSSRAGRGGAISAGAPPSSSAGRNPQEADSMATPLAPGAAMGELREGQALFRGHVRALLAKRYHNARRDRRAWCCQVGMPLVFLAVALASLKFTNVGSYPVTPLSLTSLPGSQTLLFGASAAEAGDARAFMGGLGSSSAAVLEVENATTPAQFDARLLDGYYRSDGRVRYAAFRFQAVPKWDAAAGAAAAAGVDGWAVSGFRTPGVVRPTIGPAAALWPNGFNVPVGSLWGEAAELRLPNVSRPVAVPLARLNNRLQVDLFWNATARDAVPILYHELHSQLLRSSLGTDTLKGSAVKVSNQAFPLTLAQKDLTDTQTSLFLALGFAFIPASFGAFVVLERENKSKHLQIISGVNFVSYWLATWLWDVINYLVPASLAIALIAAFGVESLVRGSNLFWSALAVVLYGLSCTSFTYMLSFLFASHTSAQNLLLVIYLFTGGILEILAIVLQVIPSTKDLLQHVLIYVFRLMPNFCLADALTNLITRTNPLLTTAYGCSMQGCDAYNLKIVGWDLLYMGVGCVVWFLVTLALELALATPRVRAWFQRRNLDVAEAVGSGAREDPDVRAEAERVRSGAADGEMVVVRGLRKVYPGRPGAAPKVAVRGVYFGIAEGQCFGYLGMNGAGKTTTMKMLTGEELCTSGEATLGGFDIKTQQNQVRQLVGYCPQFDALIGTLTAREHLVLFARIKGVPADHIRSYVDGLLDQLTLTPYADRPASTFSGGTKRKLSLGIALVGNPRIVFLDEPTTGVDPESRRFLWTLISTTMQGRSVILTTHSMDECEALCSRMGIMVNGALVCLGSAARLKAVHGAGYQFDVAFRQGADSQVAFQRLLAFVTSCFPEGARVMEGGPGSSRVKLRLPKGVMPISALFRAVELQRAELELAEYSVSETTLDQIFINFAKHQVDAETGMPLAACVRALSGPELPSATTEAGLSSTPLTGRC